MSTFKLHAPDDTLQEYPTPDEDSLRVALQSPEGQELGIQFNADGTFTLGSWDEDGEWIELNVVRPCSYPKCPVTGVHGSLFDLASYVKAGEPQGSLF